jgi:WD40 repeat protein
MMLSSDLNRQIVARLAIAYMATVSLLSMLAGCVSIPAEQPKKTFTSIAFSPDQTLLAIANAYEIRVIDADAWQHVSTLRALPADPAGADLHLFRHGVGDNMVFLDKTRIASTGMGGLITVWDVDSGLQLAVIESLPEKEFASTIDYSDVSRRLAIGTSSGRILLTTIDNLQVDALVPLESAVGHVWDLQFSRDGKYLASASKVPPSSPHVQTPVDPSGEAADSWAQANVSETPAPPNVIIWDTASLSKVGELEGATHVLRMALVPGQQALLTVGKDVDVWTFQNREQLEEVSDPSMAAQRIAIGSAWTLAVAGTLMGIPPIGGVPGQPMGESQYDLAQVPVIPTTVSLRYSCARVAAISPDGRTIISTTRGPSHDVTAVIDRTQNQVIEKWTADPSICDMKFSPDGKYLVEATARGVFLFDTTSWKKTDLKDLLPGKLTD